jgi:AdoMet-dependent rRNA methyltransferase SPB1
MMTTNNPDKGLITAEAIQLATRLVNRQVTASQLIDEGSNRLSAYNKDGLPTWFLDDESKSYRPNIPITKEAVKALRDRQRALDARPIKKIAEAKWRKKFKEHQRLEKAKRKADGVMETEDLNDGEKARQVAKLLRRAAAGAKRPEKKIVVARGANRGIAGRPKGVKGRYKIVDARMRKEVSWEEWKTKYCNSWLTLYRPVPSSASPRPARRPGVKPLLPVVFYDDKDKSRSVLLRGGRFAHCLGHYPTLHSMFVLPCMVIDHSCGVWEQGRVWSRNAQSMYVWNIVA